LFFVFCLLSFSFCLFPDIFPCDFEGTAWQISRKERNERAKSAKRNTGFPVNFIPNVFYCACCGLKNLQVVFLQIPADSSRFGQFNIILPHCHIAGFVFYSQIPISVFCISFLIF